MKRQRKNFVGIIGLFAVAAMTAFAYNIPIPSVNAESAGATTSITVNVVNERIPTMTIVDPSDGDVVADPAVDVRFTFTNADSFVFHIKNNRTGDTYDINEPLDPSIDPAVASGTQVKALNLEDYGTYGDSFTITVSTVGVSNFAEDSVTISLKSVVVEQVDPDDPSNPEDDPVIEIKDKMPGVCSVSIQTYKLPAGNPLFDPAIVQNVESLTARIVLPFDDALAESGQYRIEVTPLTCTDPSNPDDEPQPTGTPESIIINYTTPETPAVPNTGLMFAGLNISQSDYIITGLVIFFIISGGVLIYLKKSRR